MIKGLCAVLILVLLGHDSYAQNHLWSFDMGGNSNDLGRTTYVDNKGFMYATGYFEGTNVDFNPSPTATFYLSSTANSRDGYVAKYTDAGNFVWAISIGGANLDEVTGVSVDNNGNVYITGFFRGQNVDFDPSPTGTANLNSNGESGGDPGYGGDIFIAKYNSSGQYLWAFNIGGSSTYDNGTVIVNDAAGNVYAGGYFNDIADFDPSSATANLNSGTGGIAYLAKYDTNGQYQWAFNFGVPGQNGHPFGLKIDGSANIYAVGYFIGSGGDFNPSPTATNYLTSYGSLDVFVAKYNSSGQYQWAISLGGSGADVARDVDIDNNGNLYVAGDFQNTVDFDPSSSVANLTSVGSSDIFIAKYDNNGNYKWAKRFGSSNFDIAWGVTYTRNNVYLTGSFQGTVDFSPGPLPDNLVSNAGSSDIYLTKFDLNGNYVCAFKVGGSGTDEAERITSDTSGNLYVTGILSSANTDFNPGAGVNNLSTNGAADIFVTKYIWPDNPKPAGTLSGSTICPGQQATLTFTATAGTGPFTIEYSNGTTTYTQTNVQSGVPFNLNPNPNTTTTYTLISIRDATVCPSTNNLAGITAVVTVSGGGSTDFTYRQSPCSPKTIQFFATSTGTSYSWNFGNGTTLTGNASPSVTYANYGNYTVKLIVSNGGGCADSAIKTIPVFVTQSNIIFNKDTAVCPGTTLQLATDSGVAFCWTPQATINNTTIANTTVSPVGSVTYFLTSQTLGMNLVANGNFSAGNTGFTSDYTPANPNITEGQYWVGNSPTAWNAGLSNCTDHTSGSGNMLLVNGSPAAAAKVWAQTISVTPNTNYAFSVWIQSLYAVNPASLKFSINGRAVGNNILAGTTVCQWKQFYVTWNSGNITTASLSIINNNTIVQGNDFAIDDISFATVSMRYDSFKVAIATNPNINGLGDTTVCSGTPVQLDATGGNVYSWTPAGSLSNGNIHNPIATTDTTVKYVVTGYLQPGCVGHDTVKITITPKPVITLTPNNTACAGDSFQLSATGGGTYSWSPSTGLSSTNIGNPVSTATLGIKYFVTVTSAQGCSSKDSVTVSRLQKPTVSTRGDTALCSGGGVVLTTLVTNNPIVTWSPAIGLSNPNILNPLASPNDTTRYIVTAANGSCIARDTVTINVKPRPLVTLNNDTSFCKGISLLLNATGGGTYQWSPGTGLSNNTVSNPVATPDTTTKYFVNVTGSNGCASTDSVKITIYPKPFVQSINDTSVCKNIAVNLSTTVTNANSVSWSPATGLSNPNINSPVASPNDTTRYILTAVNGTCTTKDTVTISIKPKPVVTLNNDTSFCKGISLSLNATGGGTYQWSPGTGLSNNTVSNPVTTPDTTTKYFVTVTSPNGCASTDSVKITIYQKPTVQTINDTSICKNIAVNLSTTVTNANSVSWSPATGLSNPNINSPVASPNDTTRYIVTAVNGTCTTKDTVTISIKPKPVVTLNNDTSFCKGISLSLNATGGSSYQWIPGIGLSNNTVSNPVATPDTTTKYFVTVTSPNGCASTDSVKITIYPKPFVQTINDTSVCKNISVNLNTTVINANSVSWFPATGLSNPNINSPVASPNDTTRYIITAVNGTCTTKDTVTISIKPKPIVTLNNDTSFCKGISLSLNATGGSSYQWSPTTGLSGTTISNPVATPDTTIKYFVTVTGGNGCTSKDSVKLSVYPQPFVQTIKDTSVCLGTPRVLTTNATPGVTYAWSPGRWLSDSTIASPSANPVVNTQYIVTVTTAKNCTAKDTVSLSPVNPPVVTKSPDDTICKGAVINLSAGGGISYFWTPATGLSNPNIYNPVSSTDTNITYHVQVTGSNGCTTKDSVKVTVKPPSRPFSIDPPLTSLCHSDSLLLTATGGDFYNWIAGSNILSPDSASTYVVPAGSGLQVYKVKITDTICHISSILTSTVKLNGEPLVSVNKSNDIDCKFPNAQLQATGGLIYRWQPADGLSDPNIPNPIASPASTTVYSISVTDTSGCSTTQNIQVMVNYGANKHTYDVPDAFTPNQDGLNDCFGLKSWGNVSRLELSVYNRWGERVFFTNNTTDCWDGKFKGVEQSTAAFVYVIKATTACGGEISRKGTILLIR